MDLKYTQEDCKACDGKGSKHGDGIPFEHKCLDCGSTGRVFVSNPDAKAKIDKEEFRKMVEGMRGSFGKPSEEAKSRMANDPHNGTLGWWKVHGIRHSAMVKASSATEAAEKAVKSGEVGDWEMVDATWFCIELPDVFSI